MSYQSNTIIKTFTKASISTITSSFISQLKLKVAMKISSSITSVVASIFTTDILELFSDIAVAQMGYSPYEPYLNTAY